MKRILFVDDEPNVLEGLRRLLRQQRGSWDTVFASGGAEALAELERAPFDVIVSDMRMPGMDGATLLTRVQERFPGVVRLVLSGHTELAVALHAVPVAHHFLTKPCDAATLQETVERSLELRALLADDALRAMVGEMEGLPSLPRVYAALTQALGDPDVDLDHIAGIIEQDVAMCAKLLHVVNSGFFGRARRLSSIKAAVAALGTSMVRNLVMSVEVFRSFEGIKVPGFSLEALQRHALLTGAIAARLLTDKVLADLAYMAGLLHDVGQLVLAVRRPGDWAGVLAAARAEGRPLHVVEADSGTVTHAEVGAYLLGIWGLPYPIVEATAHHHDPARVNQRRFEVVAALHVADALAHEQEGGDRRAGLPPPLDVAYLEKLGVADRLPTWRALAAEQASTPAAA